jgi:hypothetical protein
LAHSLLEDRRPAGAAPTIQRLVGLVRKTEHIHDRPPRRCVIGRAPWTKPMSSVRRYQRLPQAWDLGTAECRPVGEALQRLEQDGGRADRRTIQARGQARGQVAGCAAFD